MSKDIGVTVAEAKRYIKNYLDNFPKVSEFMDKTVDDGIKNGYVTTLFGRRRYIPELSASNKVLQAFGKRAAMNAPIQGAAADIIKIAMVRVYKKLREEDLDARLILQVHDELIIEAAEKDKDRAEKILKDVRGVGMVYFSDEDVVRHDMVGRIIRAYETYYKQDH